MTNVVEIDDPNSVTVEGEAGAVVQVTSTGSTVEIESPCGDQVIEVGSPQIVQIDNVGGQQVVVISSTDTIVVVIEGTGAQGPPGPTAIWENESFTISATDVANGYIDISFVPTLGSEFVFRNGIFQETDCYSLVGQRITWTSTRPPNVGDSVFVKYTRS
jgi:hypothetical protein